MKNLKFLIIAMAMTLTISSYGQGQRRMPGGSVAGYGSTNMKQMTAQGVVTTFQKDTLVNTDTGYSYIWVGQGFDMLFDVLVTTVTGTVSSDTIILYGCNNNGVPLTAAGVLTANLHAITGNTTYCADCIGASATAIPGTSKHYLFEVPNSKGCLFDNYVVRVKVAGTQTSTYSTKIVSQY